MAMTSGLQHAQTLRARLAADLAAVRQEFAEDAQAGRAGLEVLGRYADRMDGLVRELAEAARAQTTLPVVVCALGGYGRRTLCLHSDIDLLIVVDGAIGREEELAISALLQPLWDLRLTVGQHVRELTDFDVVESDNEELLLALYDLRYIAGDQPLFERLRAAVGASAQERARAALAALLKLSDVRYDRFNGTFYQLEPDVKDAPGALRDIEAIGLLRRFRGGGDTPGRALADDRLAEAQELLFRVRSLLHVASGRNHNTLTHEMQESVAEALGAVGDTARQRVESLMSDYFRRARQVVRSLEAARLSAQPVIEHMPARRVNKYIEIGADGVRFTDMDRVAMMPAVWVEAFRVALAHGCRVSEQARHCIERNVLAYSAEDFVTTEGDRLQLRNLFVPRPGLYARLSEMHDCGLLGTIFPEFEKVHSRVIRDFYHRFTVDEHTLLTIRNVEALRTPETCSRERYASLLSEIHAPELLTLALLYHDVGKWRDEDHAVESVLLAEPMLERLQVPAEARQTITFLIRQHLQMSRAAFLGDSEDPDVVGRFAALVRTEENLKLLCLLTLADIGAVSPETLTPWKEELLWRLYVDTYNRLTLGYADELIQRDHAGLDVVIAGRPDDISEQELWGFLDGLPRRYASLFGLATIYRHVRLARDIHPDEVHASLEKHENAWELSVVTLDKPYLFSNISGVLSYFGMDIHRGQAITTPNGLVLDVFEFTDDEEFLARNASGATELQRVLQEAVAGTNDVTALLQGKLRSVLYRRRPRFVPVVRFDNEHSQKYTVLEIITDDALGLLHRISRTVSRQGCAVDLALISTEGKKAIDVLHVTKQGQKLSESDQAALTQDLEHMLEGTHENG